MKIDTSNLVENILVKGLGIEYYERIMRDVYNVNVSTNLDFQKNFNYFYKVRRDDTWRYHYYTLFEKSKSKENLSFAEIITSLYNSTGQIEASFSSKLVATLNPNKPIWDQYVLKSLGLQLKGKTQGEKLLNAIQLYDNIVIWYSKYIMTDNAKEVIEKFNIMIPNYQWLTDIKKIDYIIWSTR